MGGASKTAVYLAGVIAFGLASICVVGADPSSSFVFLSIKATWYLAGCLAGVNIGGASKTAVYSAGVIVLGLASICVVGVDPSSTSVFLSIRATVYLAGCLAGVNIGDVASGTAWYFAWGLASICVVGADPSSSRAISAGELVGGLAGYMAGYLVEVFFIAGYLAGYLACCSGICVVGADHSSSFTSLAISVGELVGWLAGCMAGYLVEVFFMAGYLTGYLAGCSR